MACTNCTRLANNAANMILNGVNTQVCNSLQKNTGFDPTVNTNNCTDLHDLSGCIKSTLASEIETIDACDWRNMIRYMIRNQYIMNESLICSDCGQWLEIEKIWDAIDQILTDGADYVELVRDVDFTFNWQNGWTSQYGNAPSFRFFETGDHVKKLVIATNGSSDPSFFSQLQRDPLDGSVFSHASLDEVGYQLSCCIFSYTFIGEYAYLNSARYAESSAIGQNIMNNRPLSARASWPIVYGIQRNPSWGNGDTYYLYMGGIADGWNAQWSQYTANNTPVERCTGANISHSYTWYV